MKKLALLLVIVMFLATVLSPHEMFCKHSIQSKEESSFFETFIATFGHGNVGYLPMLQAFDYDSYEACVTSYAHGTGEELAGKYVEMLKSLQSVQ